MVKKHTLDTTDLLWDEFLQLKIKRGFKNNDEALEEILKDAIQKDKNQKNYYLQDKTVELPATTEAQIESFIKDIKTLEISNGKPLLVLHDKKTDVFYVECHVVSEELIKKMDLDAVIDPDHQDDIRANREIQPNNAFFKKMKEDATKGRQFSDIVIEYADYGDPKHPLKVLGGQHRSKAIEDSKENRFHGVRVYFDLTKEKRVELYIASNSNIQVPPDILDRLDETSLDPPRKLRNFCYKIGIMTSPQDFHERRSSEEEASPTVRMMRTFIINFFEGKKYSGNADEDAPIPEIAETGGKEDKNYLKLFKEKDFGKENDLVDAGKAFVKLHKKQFEIIQGMDTSSKKEFRIKAFNLSLIAAWAFAAGALQKNPSRLQKFYKLPDLSKKHDPLNAEAMQKAKHPQIDKNTNYRGLGTRTDEYDRGRLLQLFIEYSNSNKTDINLDMCNTAIELFHGNLSRRLAIQKRKRSF